MAAVHGVIDSLNDTEGRVKKMIGDTKALLDELAKKRKEWADFRKKNDQRKNLLEDLEKLADKDINGFEELKRKLALADQLLGENEDVMRAMKGNPDYETKQKPIDKVIQQLGQWRGVQKGVEGEKEGLEPRVLAL